MMSQKKRILCAILTAAMLLLGGCGNHTTNQSTEKPASKTAEVAVENLEYHEVKKIEKTDVLDVSLVYPQFKNLENKPGLNAINAFYTKEFEHQKTSVVTEQMAMAKESYEFSKTSPDFPFLMNGLTVGYELMNKENGKISVLQSFSVFTGGAHPNTGYASQTYDLQTGKAITLAQVMGLSTEETEKTVLKQVLAEMEKKEASGESMYNESYKKDCRDYFNPSQFYLKDGKLYVYYQVYDIAAYAAGLPVFEIKTK